MGFNVTFNNIFAVSWRSVLLMKETGVPGENYQAKSRKTRTSRNQQQHEPHKKLRVSSH
jgi:hypothetical protein